MSRCVRCSRQRLACICASVARRHEQENKRDRAKKRDTNPTRAYVLKPKGPSLWCSCGCLIRDGRCVSATCGKSA